MDSKELEKKQQEARLQEELRLKEQMAKADLLVYHNTLNLWAEQAKSRKNPIAANNILMHFVDCVQEGYLPPDTLMKYLAGCVEDVLLKRANFEKSSGLTVGRGMQSKKPEAFRMWQMHRKLRGEGKTYEDAISTMAGKLNKSEDAIKSAISPFISEMNKAKKIPSISDS